MAIDITVEAKTIDSIKVTGSGYLARLEVYLGFVELADSISTKTIVEEYDINQLLEEIGKQYVQGWLEEQGYSATTGNADIKEGC